MSPGTEDKLLIKGLGGKKTLNGEIKVNSAKNAVLKAMAASVLFKDPMTIKSVPVTEDTKKMSSLLSLLGASITTSKGGGQGGDMVIDTRGIASTHLDHKISESMRASVVLTGPVLARYGAVSFPAPGGCVIGPRPIDLFLEGYRKMGAEVTRDNGRYVIKAKGGKLRGADIFFNMQTVGGTETLMMAAVLAKGKTVLRNCAMEPEIVSLAEYLVSCGAKISGHGTPTMTIIGGSTLSAKRKPCRVIPDRIEAGCFLILGALCADELTVSGIIPGHIQSLTNLLRDSGVPLEIGKNYVRISKNGKVENQSFKGFNVRTHEYPGFPTDLQAPLVTYLTQVSGESKVFETIYESRFKYVQNLLSMGADVTVMNPREILVKGPKPLKASTEELDAYDIRAGFATIIAALTAKGNSMIRNVYYIDRGHEAVDARLRAVGADVTRVHGSDSIVL